jgi:hypothetical protein
VVVADGTLKAARGSGEFVARQTPGPVVMRRTPSPAKQLFKSLISK